MNHSGRRALNVAVIGVGGIARMHMAGWEASPHARVVAGADLNAQVLEKWGKQHNVAKLVSDPAELFADPAIDIVDICTPNRYHAPLSIAALDAGKHVMCEKPLALTTEQVAEMIAARDRSDRLLMTAQNWRFNGTVRALKAEIDAGALGDIYHARSWMLRRALVPVRPGFILKEHSGGGPCIDIGVHILDLTLWMMGNPRPVSVTGVARAEIAHQKGAFSNWGMAEVPPEFDVEDFAAGFVRFDNGATLILEVSWLLHHESATGEDMQMWLYGTRGGARWPQNEICDSNYRTKQHYNRTLKLKDEPLPPHAAECVAFAEAILEGKPSPVPPEASLDVIGILDALYRSQESGREVRLDEPVEALAQ